MTAEALLLPWAGCSLRRAGGAFCSADCTTMKRPGLHVVAAGGADAGLEDLLQVGFGDGESRQSWGVARRIMNRLCECLRCRLLVKPLTLGPLPLRALKNRAASKK